MPLGVFGPIRYLRLCAKASVPESAMVRADVSSGVNRDKPGLEDSGGNTKLIGKGYSYLVWCPLVEGQHSAKVHEVDENPIRGKGVVSP